MTKIEVEHWTCMNCKMFWMLWVSKNDVYQLQLLHCSLQTKMTLQHKQYAREEKIEEKNTVYPDIDKNI